MSALGRLLGDVAATFSDRPWYLFGAQAVIAWAVPRQTADADITVIAEIGELTALGDRLLSEPFVPRVPPERLRTLVTTAMVAPVVHGPTGLPVDVVFGITEVEALIARSAVRMDLGGTIAPVATREHLVVLKVLAGRPKDIEDVREILKRATSFDARAARAVLVGLEGWTERSDLVPLFDSLLAASHPRRP